MNAVEALEAAITKLERLRDASTPGPWEMSGHEIVRSSEGLSRIQSLWVADIDATGDDVQLILTLHPAIDPIIALLRDGLEQARSEERYPHYWYTPPKDSTLDVARAILGES